MEWLLAPTSSLLCLILFVPLLVLLGAAVLLVAGHIVHTSPTLSRVAFACPFSKRTATVEFLSSPEDDKPTDVLSCSVFEKPYHVRCEKGCLGLAELHRTPSPLMPRFALLADGTAYRSGTAPDGRTPSEAADRARVA